MKELCCVGFTIQNYSRPEKVRQKSCRFECTAADAIIRFRVVSTQYIYMVYFFINIIDDCTKNILFIRLPGLCPK